MDENPFKPGDTVRLKSGGPLMTVSGCELDVCWCTWFDDKKNLQTEKFVQHILKKSDDDPTYA